LGRRAALRARCNCHLRHVSALAYDMRTRDETDPLHLSRRRSSASACVRCVPLPASGSRASTPTVHACPTLYLTMRSTWVLVEPDLITRLRDSIRRAVRAQESNLPSAALRLPLDDPARTGPAPRSTACARHHSNSQGLVEAGAARGFQSASAVPSSPAGPALHWVSAGERPSRSATCPTYLPFWGYALVRHFHVRRANPAPAGPLLLVPRRSGRTTILCRVRLPGEAVRVPKSRAAFTMHRADPPPEPLLALSYRGLCRGRIR